MAFNLNYLDIVTFDTAKYLKQVGYPQLKADWSYGVNDCGLYNFVDDADYVVAAPYVMGVYLWLWKIKNIFIKLNIIDNKFHYLIERDSRYYNGNSNWDTFGVYSLESYDDQESAINAALAIIVKEDLLK